MDGKEIVNGIFDYIQKVEKFKSEIFLLLYYGKKAYFGDREKECPDSTWLCITYIEKLLKDLEMFEEYTKFIDEWGSS